jgi:hypothetical protein
VKLQKTMAMVIFLIFCMAIIIASLGVWMVASKAKNDQTIDHSWRSLATTPTNSVFTQDMIADLPAPVQRYFRHAIAVGTPLAQSVHLTMHGAIRLAPKQNWMLLTAEERLSSKGLVWKAKAGQGLMQMQGADVYANGTGRVQFSLWGLIPFVEAHSPDIDRSAAGRWVGELFWLPSALLPQYGVHWLALDEQTIQATIDVKQESVTLNLKIDSEGRLRQVSFQRWGNQTADQTFAYLPFGSEVQSEQTFSGYTIPTQLSAGWHFGTDQYFEFFRVTVHQATFT